jgi:hypothetical protein
MLHLLGLQADYATDGRVISQVLADPGHALERTAPLARAYQAINSSVGPLATATLIADSRALAGGTAGDDTAYDATEAALTRIADARDLLAAQMKAELARAAAGHGVGRGKAAHLILRAHDLVLQAEQLG